MEIKVEITNILSKLKDYDTTKELENKRFILEYLFKNSSKEIRTILREDFNRLTKEIYEENKNEKNH